MLQKWVTRLHGTASVNGIVISHGNQMEMVARGVEIGDKRSGKEGRNCFFVARGCVNAEIVTLKT
jgi:hypothetical protein